MGKGYCCAGMKHYATYKCYRSYHKNRFKCPDCIIHYEKKVKEYGLIVHDGSGGYIPINYCPWCGHKLNKKDTKKISKDRQEFVGSVA